MASYQYTIQRSVMRLNGILSFLIMVCVLFDGRTTHASTLTKGRAGNVEPASDLEVALTALLQRVVTEDGLVRYDLLRGDLNLDFRRVLKAVEGYNIAPLSTFEERLAFWLNAYNVQMLQNIIETPGIEDIIGDGHLDAFFKTPFLNASTFISLDEIEHVILRGEAGRADIDTFKLRRLDPRIHVGLNCAAMSCPRLRKVAFTAENVYAELDLAMHDFTSSPTHFRVEGNQVVISSLLDWFGADFDRLDLPAGDFFLQYMPPTRPDYEALHEVLAGRTTDSLKALPNVRFEYRWHVNRAQ